MCSGFVLVEGNFWVGFDLCYQQLLIFRQVLNALLAVEGNVVGYFKARKLQRCEMTLSFLSIFA